MNVQSVQSEKGWGKKAQFYKIALENKVDLLIYVIIVNVLMLDCSFWKYFTSIYFSQHLESVHYLLIL